MPSFSQKKILWLYGRSLKTRACDGNCDRYLIIMMLFSEDIINAMELVHKTP
jgi:hypothetical protein